VPAVAYVLTVVLPIAAGLLPTAVVVVQILVAADEVHGDIIVGEGVADSVVAEDTQRLLLLLMLDILGVEQQLTDASEEVDRPYAEVGIPAAAEVL
jgi:hypothetical protein